MRVIFIVSSLVLWSAADGFTSLQPRGVLLSLPTRPLQELRVPRPGAAGSSRACVPAESSKALPPSLSESDDAGVWRLGILALTILWSTNFAFIKAIFVSIPDLDPSLYAAVRFTIAAIVLLPTYYNALGNKVLVRSSAVCAVWVMLGYLGQSLGLKLGSTADKSAFISSLVVVWVAIAPVLYYAALKVMGGQPGNPSVQPVWSTVLLAVCGIALLELQGSSPPTWGDAWSLLQPVGFGTSYFFMERQMKLHGSSSPEAPRQATGLRVLSIAAMSLLWAASTGSLRVDNLAQIAQSPEAVASLMYLGCVTTAGGLWLQTLAFRRVSASDASMILSSEPVWAAIFSAVLLGEQVTPIEAVGGGMIITACVANEYLTKRE